MKLKLISLTTTLLFADPSTNNLSIRETKLTDIKLNIYNGNSIAVYKDKAKSQYYVIPQVLSTQSYLNKIKKDLENINNNDIVTLYLDVALLTDEVQNAIAQKLNLRRGENDLNISTVPPEAISFPSITQLEIHATVGKRTRLVFHYPQNEKAFDSNATIILQGIPAHIKLEITDSVKNLKKFINNPKLEIKALTGGFATKTNSINVKIKNVISSELHNDLTGNETLKDKITFFNTSQSSGSGINLGVISIGSVGHRGKSGEERDLKRVVSRKHIMDAIQTNASTIKGSLWMENSKADFIKRMEAKIFALYDNIELKYNEQTKSFTNDVFKMTLNTGTLADLTSHAENEFEVKSSRSGSIEGASMKEGIEVKDENDITWTKKGGTFIPSKITLHQINRTRANRLRDISLDEIYATSGSYYLISGTAINNDTKDKSRVYELNEIGTIISSMIPWEFHTAKFRSKWIPADGREIPVGCDYEKLRKSQGKEFYFKNEEKNGKLYAPDLRGVFLRGINQFDKSETTKVQAKEFADPDGIRKAGSYQASMNKSHNHNNGGYSKLLMINGYETIEDADNSHEPNLKSSANIKASGGAESRPRNIAIYYYLRINN